MNKEDVKFTGKEYLEYIKYKDAKREQFNKEINKHLQKHKQKYIVGIIIFMFVAIINIVVDALTAEPVAKLSSEQLIMNGIIFLIFAIGISWIIHGVGFYLVRR